ncbi:ankyrin repeat domain-containing protein [Streptomyces sp. S.PB5]|uniref:ankyrin repeat domain-containing protein n=1 Tax=Streptomyces sp. S.PB5 TaxID=3020844 RepID=UPI0025B21DDB|nr:ankyrin repeat domain-containing protein [Streptomyces sp. S.PB5]MDN3029489.1 ankyrin repeat domain-containing protein [Streptomyces sp. S.PB5]
MTGRDEGWAGIAWRDREDYDVVRRRLDQGADPDGWGSTRPLHAAAAEGSPEVVAELARRVTDVDAPGHGTTALWEAVLADRPDNARALVDAGADPWRPSIGGWSPGRLALAGPVPDLFAVPEGEAGLSEAEQVAVREGRRLVEVLGRIDQDGFSLACVAGIDAEEAMRRLGAGPANGEDVDEVLEAPYDFEVDEILHIVGVTTVPGGCVISQPWGYGPQMPGVMTRLSTGTVCYGLYANPKSGNQGSIARDGVLEAWDLHPGGAPGPDATSEEVLVAYLFRYRAAAYACAWAGLRLPDARAVLGPPDVWAELPRPGYWHD